MAVTKKGLDKTERNNIEVVGARVHNLKNVSVEFPRNQWVQVVWEVTLSQKNKGAVRLWQNGQLIIDSKNNRTLPKDILYFQQGTKGMYSSCEIGITANSKDNNLTIWVDDIKFEKLN